jgi:hypothetical protein
MDDFDVDRSDALEEADQGSGCKYSLCSDVLLQIMSGGNGEARPSL